MMAQLTVHWQTQVQADFAQCMEIHFQVQHAVHVVGLVASASACARAWLQRHFLHSVDALRAGCVS